MQIRPVGADLFHTEVRTDMTKQIFAFANTAKAKGQPQVHRVAGANVLRSIRKSFVTDSSLCIF
jgi:hypothetical protein